MSGTIKGKFGYMAPEYLAGKIDARADLFALGVIAHELLTGRPLFQWRDDMDTLFRVKQMTIESPRKWNPEIPDEIDSIVMTALDRDPDARWQRAAAMRVALTTETKRLGLAVLDHQVVAWVDRIFQDALGDVGTPAPTRVLGTSPSISASSTDEDSIVIERFDGEGTSPGHGNADELMSTRLHENSRPPSVQRTLLGSLPIAPQAMRMPLPPPPLSAERSYEQLKAFAPAPAQVIAPPVKREPRRIGNLMLLLLLFVAAAAAGAVVYFGLPYVQ
jgi:serine/threonine protein kinase